MGLNEGEDDALATLYDIYVERLYDYCLSIAHEPKAAADIVHDTVIDAARRAPRMRDRERLRSWLYAAARRRCLQRTRGRGIYWDWSGEAATGIDPESGVPLSELRAVLEGALERLDFSDQETLLLVLRHGVADDDLAAMLGVPTRRANGQAARAWSLAESAVTDEIHSRRRRCAIGQDAAAPPSGAPVLDSVERVLASPADSPEGIATHVAECLDCRRLGEVCASTLLGVPPVPVVPAGLRHRVMHTGTDPELAGYRIDIAARGGHLNPAGIPRQPDVASPTARRWIFTSGGVVGALVSAMIAAFIIGPGLPNSEIEWPWQHAPSRPGGAPSKGRPTQQPVRDPGSPGAGGTASPADPVVPQSDGHPTTPAPIQKPKGSPKPPAPGQLSVGPVAVTLQIGQETHVSLSAVQGPVIWNAVASTGQLELASQQGTIPQGATYQLKITLKRLLVQLPGRAVITFTSTTGPPQNIDVTWGLSLLQP